MNRKHAWVAAMLAAVWLQGAQAQALRPEVGRPLQQASEYLKAGKAKEALAKVREADAVGGKTGPEQLMIDRMRAATAQRAGEPAAAVQALESLMGRVGPGEQGQLAEQLAFAYSQMKDWGKTGQWIQKAQSLGNNSASLKQLQAYVQGQSGDYTAIARDAGAAVANAEQAGRRPEEADLLRLADAQQRTGNPNGQIATLEKLLAHYPKKEYWNAVLSRVQRKTGFSDRFSLDVMRLKLATGGLTKTEDFMEMAQLSLQAGLAAEGKAVVDKGFASGALGSGAEAERHKRLRDLAEKRLADAKASIDQRATEAAAQKEGNDMVNVGAILANLGQVDKGIALIEQGIAKGGLKRPEDAKLRLGIAQVQSGKLRSKGVQTLRGVKGDDGVGDLARMWIVLAGQQAG